MGKLVALLLLAAVLATGACQDDEDDLYCGESSCYDVLGTTEDAPLEEITAAYRKLARSVRAVAESRSRWLFSLQAVLRPLAVTP